MELSGAQILLHCLEKEGVKTIFGYPGGVTLDIYDAMPEYDLQHVLVRHEQAAVHAADGFARASGQVGVCLVTSGPGATNTVTGIATAYADSIPVVVFTGQVPGSLIGNDAFQEVDILGITRPCTKHNYMVRSVNELPSIVRKAFYLARSGRPGPVLVDLPRNVLNAKMKFTYPNVPVKMRSYNPTCKPNLNQLKKAARAIVEAKRPLLLLGGGVIMSDAAEEVGLLAKEFNIPVTSTLMGLGAFEASHPLNLGMLGMHGLYSANKAIGACDVLIAVGVRFDDRVTGRVSAFAPNACIIHIDIDPTSIRKSVEVNIPVVADCKIALQELLKLLRPSEEGSGANSKTGNRAACEPDRGPVGKAGSPNAWLAQLQTWEKECPVRTCLAQKQAPDQKGQIGQAEQALPADTAHSAAQNTSGNGSYAQTASLPDPRLVIEAIYKAAMEVADLKKAASENLEEKPDENLGKVIISTEVGQHQMWVAQFYPFAAPRTLLTSGGLGTMGYGFPAAIGAQMAMPGSLVIDIAGDGSIQMNIQELATAAAYKLPVKIVVLNNRYLGMVRQLQEFFYAGRYAAVDIETQPDFVKLAEAYGLEGYRVTSPQALLPTLRQAFASPNAALIDVQIGRQENVYPMVPAGLSLEEMLLA